MAGSKGRKPRPFRREALDPYAVAELRPRLGPGERLWRYTVAVPLEEITPLKRQKATWPDLTNLQEMFADHVGGFTRLPDSAGYGLRDPKKPDTIEMNFNAYFAVLVSPVPEAEAYFRALREELEDALVEGVILIERQDVWIP